MYELQNGIQFETIPSSNAENGDLKNSDYPSIYIAVLLGVHVFDCDVTGVPCEGAVCQCDHYLHFWYSIVPMHKNTGICIYVTENNILWLYFHSSLHVVLTGCRFIRQ